MKRLIPVIAALALSLILPLHSQPVIANNFIASTSFQSQSGATTPVVYEWFSNNQTRVDLGGIRTFQLSPSVTGFGLTNVYNPQSGVCAQSSFFVTTPVPGPWDFLAQSSQAGACSCNGKSGTLWTYQIPWGTGFNEGPLKGATRIDVCANGNTPIAIAWLGPSGSGPSPALSTCLSPTVQGESVYAEMLMNSFTPGVPAASNFALPPACADAKAGCAQASGAPSAPVSLAMPIAGRPLPPGVVSTEPAPVPVTLACPF